MSDKAPTINLLASTTLTANIQAQLPGDGADVWRPFEFRATFKVLDESEREALDEKSLSTGDYLREVLVSVDGVPAGTLPDGTEVTAKEAAIRNPFTSGALLGEYVARFAKNANDAASRHASKNSKRSRSR